MWALDWRLLSIDASEPMKETFNEGGRTSRGVVREPCRLKSEEMSTDAPSSKSRTSEGRSKEEVVTSMRSSLTVVSETVADVHGVLLLVGHKVIFSVLRSVLSGPNRCHR